MSDSFNLGSFDVSKFDANTLAALLSNEGFDVLGFIAAEWTTIGDKTEGRVVGAIGPVAEVSPLLTALSKEDFDLGRFLDRSTAKPVAGAPQASRPALPSVPVRSWLPGDARLKVYDLKDGKVVENGTSPNTVEDILDAQRWGYGRMRLRSDHSQVAYAAKGISSDANWEWLRDVRPGQTSGFDQVDEPASTSASKDDKSFKGRRGRRDTRRPASH